MAIIRPSTDLLVSGWSSTASTASEVLDETTASDADYISAAVAGAKVLVALGTTTDPGSNDNHVLRYRASSPEGDRGLIARVVETGFPSIVTSKQPWRRQPTGQVEIDFGNVFGRNVKHAIYPASMGGWSSNTLIGTGAIGQELSFFAASSHHALADARVRTFPFTFITVVKRKSIGTNHAVMSLGAGTNDRQVLYFTSDNKLGLFSGAGGTSGQALTTSVYESTTAYLVIVGVVASAASRSIYVNGALVASNTTSVSPAAATKVAVGAFYNSGALVAGFYLTGAIPLAAVLGRAISSEEARNISANPWQIFKPKKQISYFDAPKLIATRTPTLTTSLADYTINLSSGEAGAITNYTKLAVEFESS